MQNSIKEKKGKRREKKRRIKAHPDPPDQLRNYEAGHTYGGLKNEPWKKHTMSRGQRFED